MQKYAITIEETVVDTFVVEANSEEEARNMGEESYKRGVFVLEPGELIDKKMCVNIVGEDMGEWIQF